MKIIIWQCACVVLVVLALDFGDNIAAGLFALAVAVSLFAETSESRK